MLSETFQARLRHKLSQREKLILQHVVHNFILTADPVGSRALAKKYDLGLSAATIRNAMSDLEDMGLLSHPHTSAGRVPTDLGYRFYVDDLMEIEELSLDLREKINNRVESVPGEVSALINDVSDILSEVTRLLSVITEPDASDAVLDKVEIIRLSAEKILVVVILSSGTVKTINFELRYRITDQEIHEAVRFINNRLGGMKLMQIPIHISNRLSGDTRNKNAVIRLFLEFPEKIFVSKSKSEMHIGGTRHVLELPEYQSPEKVKGIIELIEDKDVIVHLLKERSPGLSITIGEENSEVQFRDLSVITSSYRIGEHIGTVGIIGPTRMNYSQLISLVEYTSKLVTERAAAEE